MNGPIIFKHLAECEENNNWSVVIRKAGLKEGGYYSATAFNSSGSCSTELILEMLPNKIVEKVIDDTKIHYDESVVSGDISDVDFMKEMVSAFMIIPDFDLTFAH